nr:acyltransferase [Lachnospiraceae bacterium]
IGACGKFGVQMFFVISAMLAFASYERNVKDKKIALKWVGRKLLYLLPFFYIMIVLNLLITGGFAEYYANDGTVTVWNVLSHLTLTMGLFPKYANSILGVEWYLGVLTIFFVLVPVFYRFIKSEASAIVAVILSVLLFVVTDKFGHMLIPAGADEHVHQLFLGQFSIIPNLPVLFTGVLLFYLFKKKAVEPGNDNRVMSAAFIGMALMIAAGLVLGLNSLFLIPYTLLWAIVFALLILAMSYHPWALIDNPLFRLIGRNTYCIYLVHYLLIILYDRYIGSTGNGTIDWIVKYAVITAVSLAISVIYTRFVDKPYRNFCDRSLRE